jgi:hypothetical protein
MNISSKQRLSELVKRLRGDQSYRAYGRFLGVSGTTVQGWENMTSEPATENLEQLAKQAGYSMQELLDHLHGKSVNEEISVARMVRHIAIMSRDEVAKIVKAGVDRLAIAEGVGSK